METVGAQFDGLAQPRQPHDDVTPATCSRAIRLVVNGVVDDRILITLGKPP